MRKIIDIFWKLLEILFSRSGSYRKSLESVKESMEIEEDIKRKQGKVDDEEHAFDDSDWNAG